MLEALKHERFFKFPTSTPGGGVNLFVFTFKFYQELQIYSHTHHMLAEVLYKSNTIYIWILVF
jgi:hypothetical protein